MVSIGYYKGKNRLVLNNDSYRNCNLTDRYFKTLTHIACE